VAARRMPPPANLPSMKSEHLVNDTTNVNIIPQNQSGWSTTATIANTPSTTTTTTTTSTTGPNNAPIAKTVDHNPIKNDHLDDRQNYQRQTWTTNSSSHVGFNKTNEFPKLDEALVTVNQNQTQHQMRQQQQPEVDGSGKDDTGLVLKPANVGTWGTTRTTPATTSEKAACTNQVTQQNPLASLPSPLFEGHNQSQSNTSAQFKATSHDQNRVPKYQQQQHNNNNYAPYHSTNRHRNSYQSNNTDQHANNYSKNEFNHKRVNQQASASQNDSTETVCICMMPA
jgi:hypothetical protein